MTIVPSPPAGAMKPSPHGRLPNAPRRGQVAVVGDAAAAAQVEAHVGAARAGHVRLVGLGQQLGDRAAARAPSRRSRPTSAARACRPSTPGIVAPRAPASVAALRALVCDSDGSTGAMKTSARGERGGDRLAAARSRARRAAAGRSATASAPVRRPASSSASPSSVAVGIADDQQLLARRAERGTARRSCPPRARGRGHAVAGYRWPRRLAVPAARLTRP